MKRKWKVIGRLGDTENIPISLKPRVGKRAELLLVKCVKCKGATYLTQDNIDRDDKVCPCRSGKRKAIKLTHNDLTLTLSDWGKLYNIPITSIRTRYQQRKKGHSNWTDSQVILGAKGDEEDEQDVFIIKKREITEEIEKSITRKVSEIVASCVQGPVEEIANFSVRYREGKKEVTHELAGNNYFIEAMGVSLQDLMTTVEPEEAQSYLLEESYESLLDKESRLIPYIELIDKTSLKMEKGEAMQLMSLCRF